MKRRKFSVRDAMNDVRKCSGDMDDISARKTVISALKRLSKAVSHSQLAPLPKTLEGSLYDPKMLCLRSDDEFRDIYTSDLKDTVEECMTEIVYTILLYDIVYDEKCHVYDKDSDDIVWIETDSVKFDIRMYSDALIEEYGAERYAYAVSGMLSKLYPYIIRLAERVRFDLNVYLKWYIRYRGL